MQAKSLLFLPVVNSKGQLISHLFRTCNFIEIPNSVEALTQIAKCMFLFSTEDVYISYRN